MKIFCKDCKKILWFWTKKEIYNDHVKCEICHLKYNYKSANKLISELYRKSDNYGHINFSLICGYNNKHLERKKNAKKIIIDAYLYATLLKDCDFHKSVERELAGKLKVIEFILGMKIEVRSDITGWYLK